MNAQILPLLESELVETPAPLNNFTITKINNCVNKHFSKRKPTLNPGQRRNYRTRLTPAFELPFSNAFFVEEFI